ncbi:hypothetical protein COV18_01055 [Candidatus Woesearchaeota archaeon CG10_big_fil_rev_8_21_14_0_10_37_12]|nr:MAG: hypothetical protein COV18_01055 [Candidatus Woesearchaeota archaeon CG10_big_fil_rev_8_21_14_0_10_37_12]
MKDKYSFMASKEVKQFLKLINDQYGILPKQIKENALVLGKEKIYLITRSIDNISLENLRINSIGLYIAEVKANEQIRLSIEGSQLIGPIATKNVCEVNEEQMKEWIQGKDIEMTGDYSGFVIIKYKTDHLGSGKYKDGMIFNYVPKARRLVQVH